jgi:uncharacterized LabA/DUF88 family protein
MAARRKSIIRIGIYYDGHYFYKTSNYYKFDHPRQARVSIPGLHNFICNELAVKMDADVESCKVVEAHYFRGRTAKAGNEKAIVGERYFEDALTKSGVDLHYLPLMRGANNELKEKGIDVSLALDAYKKAAAKSFDIFALVAGDGDYLPLVRELQTMSTPVEVMLISWDFECANGDITMTSQDLLEEVKYPVQMASVIDDRLNLKTPVILGLFEPRPAEAPGGPFPFQTAGAGSPQAPFYQPPIPQPSPFAPPFSHQGHPPSQPPFPAKRKVLSEAEMAQERISAILSLNGSGGWIRDAEYNNFYFFFSDVVNRKPEELAVGMTLQFRLRFDRVKTEQKDNGEPSYRAVGPIYAVD